MGMYVYARSRVWWNQRGKMMSYPAIVRGEPEYPDQVPRRLAYEAAHPDVKILYLGPYWQAIISEDDGDTIVVRYHLETLLDRLEEMDGSPGADGPPGA
jgi:hypothetical protein